MPELRTQAERDEVFRKFKVRTTAVCNRCDQPIKGLVYVDPKGGYFKKPEGTPDFIARLAKVTYDRECHDMARGKKPQYSPSMDKVAKQAWDSVKKAEDQMLGTKMLRRLAQKVVDTIRGDRKKQWQVWDIICTLKSVASQQDLRTVCNWLKKQGFMVRKNGHLWVHPTRPLP